MLKCPKCDHGWLYNPNPKICRNCKGAGELFEEFDILGFLKPNIDFMTLVVCGFINDKTFMGFPPSNLMTEGCYRPMPEGRVRIHIIETKPPPYHRRKVEGVVPMFKDFAQLFEDIFESYSTNREVMV